MKLYRFKTFRTSYYFPQIEKGNSSLYGVYFPFGWVAKCYWWMFRHCFLLRKFNEAKNPDLEFPYSRIMKLLPQKCKASFNMGTPGPEQKISILGIDADGNRFFAKYSEKSKAMALTRNEWQILNNLKGTGLAPSIFDWKEDDSFCFLQTAYVEGTTYKQLRLEKDVVDLAVKVSQRHLFDYKAAEIKLETSLSHGDFTPWNMLVKNGKIRLIDWEMADERELGYDLFTFITQVNMLFSPEKPANYAISENKFFLDFYFKSFGINDWRPYLVAFSERRMKYAKDKDDKLLADRMQQLKTY